MSGIVSFDFNYKKTEQCLLYLADRVPGFTQYKACKMLFLADRKHLVKYGRPITGDSYAALEYGPIPSRVRNFLVELINGESQSFESKALGKVFSLDKKHTQPRFVPNVKCDLSYLSISEVRVLDEIIQDFGGKGFEELKLITHEMVAYTNAWNSRESKKSAPMAFEDFFEESDDAIEGVYENMMEEHACGR